MAANTQSAKSNNSKVSFKEKFGINKKKVLSSLMVCGAVLVLLVASAYTSFFHISSRMAFKFMDFAPLYTGICLLIFAVCFVSLLLTKGALHNTLSALYSSIALIGGIQNMITTITFQGMPGDGNTSRPTIGAQILNLVLWVAIAALIFWVTVFAKKKDFGKLIISFGLLFVMVTQTGSAVIEGINASSPKDDSQASVDGPKGTSHLTTLNMFEVSDKKNVIVFVLDRFDKDYFDSFINSGSEYLNALDGFTYYNDNISKYPRTFPAVTSMLTGMDYDFSTSRENYMTSAYSNSTFFQDLHNNDYKINLYLPLTDGYTNASVFDEWVSNTTNTEGYEVSKSVLAKNIFFLSSYFWAPDIIKAKLSISESKLNNLVTRLGDYPQYVLSNTSDAEYYDEFCREGLSTQSDKNTFTFLHLRGCHAPFTLDANCEIFDVNGTYNYSDLLVQTTGVFKFISEYLQQLKTLGLYDDATIIITGDHAALETDTKPYEMDAVPQKLTALLVKESGSSGTPLRTSTAQVSQDNFLATIIKSAGIHTTHDYGKAYSDIKEGETVERYHYFQTLGSDSKVYPYTITGPGNDFSNWKLNN